MTSRQRRADATINIGIFSDQHIVRTAIEDIVQATSGRPLRPLTIDEEILIHIGRQQERAEEIAAAYQAKRLIEIARRSREPALRSRWEKFAVAVQLAHGEQVDERARP